MEQYRTVNSQQDGLPLDVLEVIPDGKIVGLVQIVHGMQEHKERYLAFMRFMARQGYLCAAHDHRGHGKSVRSEEDLGYFYDETGDAIVEDVNTVGTMIRADHPELPLLMLGHSMGSLVVRKYLKKYDDTLCGLVISGAVYENPAAKPGKIIVRALGYRHGDKRVSSMVSKLIDGSFDKQIEGSVKNRWLSRNEDNVQAFNDDPLCGFPFTFNGYRNLLQLVLDVYDEKGWQMNNPDLPVLFLGGEEDPVIGGQKHFDKTMQAMRARGYTHVEGKLYPHMRHEILNEINRQTVYDDILAFMDQCLVDRPAPSEVHAGQKKAR